MNSPYCVTTTAIKNAANPSSSSASSGVCVDVITASELETVLVSYTAFPQPNPTHVACGATRIAPDFVISASTKTATDVEGSLPFGIDGEDFQDPHYTEQTSQGFESVSDFQDSILGNLASMTDAPTITSIDTSARVDDNPGSDETMSFPTYQSAASATTSTPQSSTTSMGSGSLHHTRSLTVGAWALVLFQMYFS